MKHLLIISITLTISITLFSQEKYYLDSRYQPCERNSAEYYVTGEAPENGKSEMYYLDGRLHRESHFRNGVLHGLDIFYTEFEDPQYILKWNNGEVIEQNHFAYDADGKLLKTLIGEMNDGLPTGIMNNYWPDGRLKKSIYVRDGVEDESFYISCSEFGDCKKVWKYSFPDKLNSHWPVGQITDEIKTSIVNDSYVITSNTSTSSMPRPIFSRLELNPYENYTIKVGLEISAFVSGVVFGDADNDSYYMVSVMPFNGRFMVEGWEDGIDMNIMNDFEYNSVLEGNWDVDLEISRSSGVILFKVDNHPIAQIADEGYFGNGFGIYTVKGKTAVKYITAFTEFKDNGGEYGYQRPDNWYNGSGILISNYGYVLTNYHVIENSREIQVGIKSGNSIMTFDATIVVEDSELDLAVLKLNDFEDIGTRVYFSVSNSEAEVGEEVFTLGYPYALTYLGEEVKFTDGKISSRSGFQGDINHYQITTPIQPGNSGGPLFNTDGALVGVVNAKFTGGDNVSYAIKSSKIAPMIKDYYHPTQYDFTELDLVDVIKELSKVSVLVKVR